MPKTIFIKKLELPPQSMSITKLKLPPKSQQHQQKAAETAQKRQRKPKPGDAQLRNPRDKCGCFFGTKEHLELLSLSVTPTNPRYYLPPVDETKVEERFSQEVHDQSCKELCSRTQAELEAELQQKAAMKAVAAGTATALVVAAVAYGLFRVCTQPKNHGAAQASHKKTHRRR